MTEETEDLLSIGEFARRSGLSISALRFYGDAGVLVPAHTDRLSGYRYYAPTQLQLARLVRHLRAAEVPIVQIQALLAANPADATAQLDQHRKRLQARFKRGRVALDAAEALLSSKELYVASTTVNGSDLATAIRQVLPAAGPIGQEKQYPAAVLVELREDGLRLAATDSHRLSVRDLPVATHERGRVVIGADDASRLAGRVMGASAVSVSVWEGLVVQADADELRIPGAADDYPDYEAVLGRCGNAKLVVKTSDLLPQLDGPSQLVVLNLTRESTTANGIPFPGSYDGDDLVIGFNPTYLAEALEAGIGPDAIFQLGSEVEPVAIRSADEGTLTWLVMPIRLLDRAAAS